MRASTKASAEFKAAQEGLLGYSLWSSVNVQTAQALSFMSTAFFLTAVVDMPDEKFEHLCRYSRKLAATSIKEIEARMATIPKAERERAQLAGQLPEVPELSNTMRYFSEAESRLRQLRRAARGDGEAAV
jgi:hypothetical protein